MPVRISSRGTTTIAPRRWRGRPATTFRTWWTCCWRAARRRTCRTTSPGRRRWPGPHGAATPLSWRRSGGRGRSLERASRLPQAEDVQRGESGEEEPGQRGHGEREGRGPEIGGQPTIEDQDEGGDHGNVGGLDGAGHLEQ